MIVPDTNVFVHCKYFEEAKWTDLTGSSEVHLAIPLVVVEELDRLKFSQDSRVSDRAARRYPWTRSPTRCRAWLHRLVASAGERSRLFPRSLTMCASRPWTAEIVDVCAELAGLVSSAVSVVTGDLNMKVRARTVGVPVVDIPEGWRRPLSDHDSTPVAESASD